MPIYTDAMGNKIYVDGVDAKDEDKAKVESRQPSPSTPTPTKHLMNKVTHLPPHKAAAMASSREVSECEDKENGSNNAKPALVRTPSNNVMFQTVTPTAVTPTTEVPPSTTAASADIVAQQVAPTFGPASPVKECADPLEKATSLRRSGSDKDPFSATIQTFSTMPSSSNPVSPRPTPRLSIDLSNIPAQQQLNATPFQRPARKNSKSPSPVNNPKNGVLVYNQYGEIVKIKDMEKPKDPATLTMVQTLRLIEKVYGYECRAKMAGVIEMQMEERTYDEKDDKPITPPIRSLSSWDYADFPMSPNPDTPDHQTTLVYSGPPRVLEIGCENGAWCFASKERHPDWIIEGVDDSDHWSAVYPHLTFRDFTTPPTTCEPPPQPVDYFMGFQLSQEHPEFTVRNLNALLAHTEAFPHNLYGLIRGRDVFDRVESYKEFLEDVRLILQPDGVVEFVELDPRPRENFAEEKEDVVMKDVDDHTSGPITDWTDKIADRFKDPEYEVVATSVPGWTGRVQERLKASLRPKDGVPASRMKSWLEGAGFWDVKEMVFRLQVGGETQGGKLLQKLIQQRITMEEEIPLLCKELPKVEQDALSSGFYYFNLHIVTGRKPKYPRPGDLLLDGTRQEMTNSKYDAMAKLNDAKSNQWKRFDLDGKLTSMMKELGAGEVVGAHSARGSEGGTPAVRSPAKPLGVSKKGVSEASSNDTVV